MDRTIATPLIAFALAVCGEASAHGQTRELLLFSGDRGEVYLGCLVCSPARSDSVCNRHGPHGSKYGIESIWNDYGLYGGTYSSYSPWNTYANESPRIVDRFGGYFGRLTVNPYEPDRTRIPQLAQWLKGVGRRPDVGYMRQQFCGG